MKNDIKSILKNKEGICGVYFQDIKSDDKFGINEENFENINIEINTIENDEETIEIINAEESEDIETKTETTYFYDHTSTIKELGRIDEIKRVKVGGLDVNNPIYEDKCIISAPEVTAEEAFDFSDAIYYDLRESHEVPKLELTDYSSIPMSRLHDNIELFRNNKPKISKCRTKSHYVLYSGQRLVFCRLWVEESKSKLGYMNLPVLHQN